MGHIEAVQAYYNGSVFVPIAPTKAKQGQQAIVTILDSTVAEPTKRWYEQFFGALSSEDAADIFDTLKDTEKVDADEW